MTNQVFVNTLIRIRVKAGGKGTSVGQPWPPSCNLHVFCIDKTVPLALKCPLPGRCELTNTRLKHFLSYRFNFLKLKSNQHVVHKAVTVKFTMGKGIRTAIKRTSNYFLTGLLLSIPLLITIWVLLWVFGTVDSVLQKPIEWIFGRYYDGIGFATILFIIFIVGVIGNRVVGLKMIEFIEFQVSRVPVIRELYHGTKQILQSFSRQDESSFVEVVFIEFPRKGTFTPGLVTSVAYDEQGKRVLNVYVPTAPNPTSGFLQILPEDQVVRTSMTVDECMKMVISAGKYSHPDVAYLQASGRIPEAEKQEV